MDTRSLQGREAADRLDHGDFAAAWDVLHAACPWATGYQSRGFARAWYGSYAARFEPLLVIAEDADGALAGLLALAREPSSGALVNVGAHQAEYHAWLARPEHGEAFILAALRHLRAAFPAGTLRFRYLAPKAPTGWLRTDPDIARLAEVHAVPRPLLKLADEEREFAKRMRKSSNKSRLNRLRLACDGELAGIEIGSEPELSATIDEIARNYDTRQGAANRVRPFADDPCKRDFHLRLFREGVLHGYVLRGGARFVAAVLSIRSRDVLCVGVFAHSADLADLSPGKFGIAWLARDAARAGFGLIDLTPGGAWKDRFATDHDNVIDVTLRFCLRAARRNARRRRLEGLAKRMLESAGLTPQRLRELRYRVVALRG